jgi:hypothetical protein
MILESDGCSSMCKEGANLKLGLESSNCFSRNLFGYGKMFDGLMSAFIWDGLWMQSIRWCLCRGEIRMNDALRRWVNECRIIVQRAFGQHRYLEMMMVVIM